VWKKVIELFDRFSDWMAKPSGDPISDKINRISSAILLVNLVLATVFGTVSFVFDYPLIGWITFTAHPVYAFGIYVARKGHVDLCKVLLLMHAYLMIFAQVVINSNSSHVSLYFLPAITCTMLLLQGNIRFLGRFIAILGAGLMLISEVVVFPGMGPEITEKVRFMDQIANVVGSISITMFAMYFLLKFNDEVQQKLKVQTQEYEKMNQYLHSSNNTKTRLFSIISHDLRNPLISIKSSVSVIREPEFPEEEKTALLEELEKRVDYAMNLMNNLLIWSRTQLSGIQFQPEIIELGELTKQVTNQMEAMAQLKKVSIQFNFLHVPVLVNVDKNMIEIVLRNLISNAIKFTQAGGFVKIHGALINGKFITTISDSGVGIEPDALEKIRNQIFYTTPGTEKEKGSGLGLMLSREFLARHDSELIIDSQPGAGTRISFKLEVVDH
jgi:signal transduction histidine kinase